MYAVMLQIWYLYEFEWHACHKKIFRYLCSVWWAFSNNLLLSWCSGAGSCSGATHRLKPWTRKRPPLCSNQGIETKLKEQQWRRVPKFWLSLLCQIFLLWILKQHILSVIKLFVYFIVSNIILVDVLHDVTRRKTEIVKKCIYKIYYHLE